MEPEFLLIEEAAEMLRTPVATLYRWRTESTGPPCRKVGRRLLYPRAQLIEWASTPSGPGHQDVA